MTTPIRPACPNELLFDGRAATPIGASHRRHSFSSFVRRRAPVVVAFLVAVPWFLSHGAAWRDGGGIPAYPASATLLWEHRSGEPGQDDFVRGDAIATGGDAVFVAGSSGNDFLVQAYSADDGRLLWADAFDKAGGHDDALGVTQAGRQVFAVGGADIPANFLGIPLIRAYERETGRLLWQHEVADVRGIFDSAVVHARTVIAAGGNLAWLVQAYDAETGSVQWVDRFGVGTSNRAIGVAEHGGRVFVVGRARPLGRTLSWFVRAYDATSGGVLWEDHSAVGIGGQAQSVAVAGNRVIVAGNVVTRTTTAPFVNTDWRIRTYDAASGALLWEDVVDKGGPGFPEGPYSVAVLGDLAFVAGSGGPGCNFFFTFSPDCDFVVRAYELESGRVLWEDQLNRGDFDQAISVTAHDGRAFVVGQGGSGCTEQVNNCDILIRVYKATSGQVLWEDQVDSLGTEDAAVAVAVAGGKVFAAGYFYEPDDLHPDVLIRAYDAGVGDGDGRHIPPNPY
jgi:glucose dehydrogenase